MLKKFFLNLLSSFMGAWLAILLIGVAGIVIVFGILGNLALNNSKTDTVKLEKGSLLVVDLSGEMIDREQNQAPNLSTLFQGDLPVIRSLEVYTGALKEAATNDNVDGIYLKCDGIAIGAAAMHELREALAECRKNGKRIYAYGKQQLSQADYMIASVADSIFINPEGMLELRGIGGYTPYFKDLLDKIGVQMQVVKVGTFKSAVEPYILNEMSQPARAQLDTLYGSFWGQLKDMVSKERKVKPELIDTLINRDYISVRKPDLAIKNNLIDGICYEHQMEEKLASFMGKEKYSDINIVDVKCLYKSYQMSDSKKGKKIALLYACGEIDGAEGGIQSKEMVPLIMKLADNEEIAAMVLRVNSPGGSAFGSEQIWEALEQFKAAGKKLVVSMGDMAASGGYYISCGADKIYADPLTITGSIGIFGMIPNVNGLINEKLGVHMQLVATNPKGMFPTIVTSMTADQYAAMQQMVEEGYDTFTSRVSQGRKMPQARVKQIGEGRVWDAVTAKRIKLVDELGTLDQAITAAALLCKTKEYQIEVYPQEKPGIWSMIAEMSEQTNLSMSKYVSNETLLRWQAAKILKREPVQALMPETYIVF